MINLRAIQSGLLTWILIFSSFMIFNFIPIAKHSKDLQNILILILIIPFVLLASKFYYHKDDTLNGFQLGFTIILSCLLIDAVITVPIVIIPSGGSYLEFYTDPGLLIMGIVMLLVAQFYFKKMRQSKLLIAS